MDKKTKAVLTLMKINFFGVSSWKRIFIKFNLLGKYLVCFSFGYFVVGCKPISKLVFNEKWDLIFFSYLCKYVKKLMKILPMLKTSLSTQMNVSVLGTLNIN